MVSEDSGRLGDYPGVFYNSIGVPQRVVYGTYVFLLENKLQQTQQADQSVYHISNGLVVQHE